MASEETPVSPSIEEEDEDDNGNSEEPSPGLKETNIQDDGDPEAAQPHSSPRVAPDHKLEASAPRLPVNGPGSVRRQPDNPPAINKELEQMKVKYKIMERKRMEDRDKLKTLEALKAERDKFESTMQKLQRKCQTQSQEIAEWRRRLQESEAKVDQIERADAEHGTEVEMATLDKEMAEERLEAVTAELEILKERCEELELEAEIMRDENKELTSGMTSEERSSAGWLQMEKENQRLRDALVALRDLTQETETSLRNQVKELEDDLAHFEALKSEYEKARTDLAACRIAIQALKENLDAANHQERMIDQVTEEKEVLTEQIDLLSEKVMRLEEDAEVLREIQDTQNGTERLLQEELDDEKAFAIERDKKTQDQAKVIENLEYTLLKFKDIADGLQSDLEGLRANEQVNETEAKELNAKSRAMIDLNLRLQSTATKTQTKKIESELIQVQAEDTALHLAILQNFVPRNFKDERDPILALLRFKRIASKACLVRKSIEENIGQLTDTAQGDPYATFDMIEKLQWVSSSCSRSHNFMKGCTVEDFSKFDAALYELEPVERALDVCIDAVKRQNVDTVKCTQDLQRMIALLSDLAEKTVPSSPETFADTVIGRSEMMQLSSEIVGLELDLIKASVQSKVGGTAEDEYLHSFYQQIQRFIDRSRTCRVVGGKLLRSVDEKRNRSMTLGEPSLTSFEQAESVGKELSELLRVVGQGLVRRLTEDTAGDELFKIDEVPQIMQESARDWLKQSSCSTSESLAALEIVGEMLSGFHAKLEGLLNLSSDLSNFSEFERHPAPWKVRAETLREQKVVDVEMLEKLQKLQSHAHEQNVIITAKDKAIEEQSLKIELLEARSKGAKDHATASQKLEKELASIIAERHKAVTELDDLRKEKLVLSERYDEASAKLAALNQNQVAGDSGATAVRAANDESRSLQLAMRINLLTEEIASLQSAVRFLKAENHRLLHPISPASLAATNHSWLEANPLPKMGLVGNERVTAVAAEAKDVFSRLLEVSTSLKPLQLERVSDANTRGKQSTWRPHRTTPRYIVSQQREEFEEWAEWRDDLAERVVRGQRKKGFTRTGPPSGKSEVTETPPRGHVVDGVEIVGSPP